MTDMTDSEYLFSLAHQLDIAERIPNLYAATNEWSDTIEMTDTLVRLISPRLREIAENMEANEQLSKQVAADWSVAFKALLERHNALIVEAENLAVECLALWEKVGA